ncbi:MAG TPA: C10 family peptidase [Bacteroidales bacterium]|nr:C10 family peptidase [Bacteroidales bacterium]
MNIKILLLLQCLMIAHPFAYSEPVTSEIAAKVADAFIARSGQGNEFSVRGITDVWGENMLFFYAATLNPKGYVIIAADDDLPPVIAYSFDENLDAEGTFLSILKYDIGKRLENKEKQQAQTIENIKRQWEALIYNPEKLTALSQQWPPAGSTSTGGWLETNWTQNAPYNQMCPVDPVTSARSYVGCPATAMAQILNYHKSTNNTLFNDADDYHHNYAGRNFLIDDDYSLHGFPSFAQLNEYLDTLNLHYQHNITLTNQDKAALSFACGVAARQVYTSAGSGTFGVSQALDAYHRFGCNTVELLMNTDTALYSRLIQNMKDSLPAHLAIVDESNSSGHNVVVDGYNTDGYFHVNFGWGGSSNGWYLLPDEMPYGMTVIEGLIVDIMKQNNASVPDAGHTSYFDIFPNPANEKINVQVPGNENTFVIKIFDMSNRLLNKFTMNTAFKTIDLEGFVAGTYFILALDKNDKVLLQAKFVKI